MFQYNAQAANTQKRRRTHGYAIFSSEMRKKIVTDNLSAQDTTKLIAEQWRNASAAVRQTYVARANKYENTLLNTLKVLTVYSSYKGCLQISHFIEQ